MKETIACLKNGTIVDGHNLVQVEEVMDENKPIGSIFCCSNTVWKVVGYFIGENAVYGKKAA